MEKRYLGLLLMVVAAITLASATIIMKWIPILTVMKPGHVGVWRFAIAAPVLWLVFIIRGSHKAIIAPNIWKLLVLGVVFSFASFSAIFALGRLSASLYVIILYIYPSFVILFSLLTGQSVPKLFWVGLPLTLLGLVLTVFDFGSDLVVDRVGLLWTLSNVIFISLYILLSEKIFSKIQDQLLGTNWMMTGGMVAGILLIPIVGVSTPDSAQGWILLGSLAVFGTIMPILAMNIGLQYLGAARGSVIVNIQPVAAILFSTIFLGETLTLQQWFGGALVILAIILIQLSSDIKKGDPIKSRTIDYRKE